MQHEQVAGSVLISVSAPPFSPQHSLHLQGQVQVRWGAGAHWDAVGKVPRPTGRTEDVSPSLGGGVALLGQAMHTAYLQASFGAQYWAVMGSTLSSTWMEVREGPGCAGREAVGQGWGRRRHQGSRCGACHSSPALAQRSQLAPCAGFSDQSHHSIPVPLQSLGPRAAGPPLAVMVTVQGALLTMAAPI